MLISSYLNQLFSTDSTQLAGGVELQATQTLAMCCEKQSLAPCRELACCLVVQSDFYRTYATDETCREVSFPVLFLEKWPNRVSIVFPRIPVLSTRLSFRDCLPIPTE